MTEAFVLNKEAPNKSDSGHRRVFVTGAAGRIGSYFCQRKYQENELTMMIRPDREIPAGLEHCGQIIRLDLLDSDNLGTALNGIDTVVHLAAIPSPKAEWDDLLQHNIIGTYNLMNEARKAGCRRVVFASSIHAVSGYPGGFQVHDHDPVNPGDLYGVSKCFGEALGRYMAEQCEMSVIVLRIGAFQDRARARKPQLLSTMDAFISRRDLTGLIQNCINDQKLKFAIFHALSNNRFNCMDISGAMELVGYQPQDDFTEVNPLLQPLHLREKVKPHNRRQR